MKILFYMRAIRQLRPYKSIITALSKNGHDVHVVFDPREKKKFSTDTVEAYKKETRGFTYEFGFLRKGLIKKILFPAREIRTYRRYLSIQGQAPFYRDRWVNFLPTIIRGAIKTFPAITNGLIRTGLCDKTMRLIERLTPPVSAIVSQIQDVKPDVVLIAYRNLPSRALDLEYLKAAKHLGIPTVIPLLSWDTLTTKGLIQIEPDLLLVWNDEQVAETIEHHHIPKEKIETVGAFQFDNWLSGMKPSKTREEFCQEHGFDPKKPIMLYLGFSYSGKDKRLKDGHGPVVVEMLRKALDTHADTRLKDMQIIARPHPMHTEAFRDMHIHNAVAIPKENALMNTLADYQLLYDCVYHSICGAAINTTAIIDISIQMKPAIVLRFEEFRAVQGGTHFKKFLATGAVAVANTPKEFASLVSGYLDARDPNKEQRVAYFRTYIRPRGDTTRAGEVATERIESLVKRKRTR